MKKGKILTTMATLGMGAVAGMMIAPKKGEDLRKDVKCAMKKTVNKAEKVVDKSADSIKDTLDCIGEKIENLDFENTKKGATKKADEIKKELEKIIKEAKERKDEIVENTATKLKEGLTNKLEDLLETLED